MRLSTLLLAALVGTVSGCGGGGKPDSGDTDSGVNPDDVDGDGLGPDEDCNDEDASVGGPTTAWADADADGYGDAAAALETCTPGEGSATNDEDCDDTDAAVNPAATEVCNGRDDNCDATVDEGASDSVTWYADTDADGYGDDTLSLTACEAPDGYTADATDCDDTSAAVNPGTAEVCDGAMDEDCDGLVDEADDSTSGAATWYTDGDGDGFGDPATATTSCLAPAFGVADATDCDDTLATVNPAGVEVCDSLDTDEDCDGLADDADNSLADATTWYADADADGYGIDTATLGACDQPAAYSALAGDCDDTDTAYNPGAPELDCADPNDYNCDGAVGYADGDGDGWAACEECDDAAAGSYPGADEYCDAADNDCDGDVDEADALDAPTWYADSDIDGYGDAATSVPACSAPMGFGADATDCDDADPLVHPGAEEVCDAADVDEDCDALVDDADPSVGLQTLSYVDADNDGYGADTDAGQWSCDVPAGSVLVATDCDDGASAINRAATEVCDAVDTDEDCDALGDDGDPSAVGKGTWYADADGDSFGDAADAGALYCDPAPGLVGDATDCDDTTATVSPLGTETCNGEDDDCDATTDEDATDRLTWYQDADADLYGDAAVAALGCEVPAGYVAIDGDCDDASARVNPGATEVCDTSDTDEDCDGAADDADADVTGRASYYVDADGDGYGDTSDAGTLACDPAAGLLADATDCDDGRSAVNPAGTEACNSLDDDCDGTTDGSDAADAVTWYADADGDTYGDAGAPVLSCYEPSGFVSDTADCDDTSADISPSDTEYCNSVDDDCDGATDEDDASDALTWYLDADGDGYGVTTTTTTACTEPSGYSSDATDCDDTDASLYVDCGCTLTAVSAPTSLVSAGTTYGAWMVDPLETLGAGLVWEMNSYYGTSLVEYASQAQMVARSASDTTTLPYTYNGTGAAVYDGYLYYNAENTRTLVKYDIATGASSLLTIPDAGYRNTYHYQWGGWSDIDVAVDEEGVWVIYATSSNSGRIVVSKIDETTFTITDTWSTTSDTKTSLGNAWMMCGVLYTTDDYNLSTTTVNYAYDTSDGSSWNPAISFQNLSYNSSINYNPTDGVLRSWDNTYRRIYSTTTE